MLLKLLTHTDRNRFTPAVWCLTDEGPIAERIRDLGIPVTSIQMQRGLPDMAAVIRLASELRRFKPDVAQTWLYHADVAGGIAARMAGIRRVVWNIRNSVFDPTHAKKSTVLMAKIAARLSSILPDAILSCSDTARKEHIAIGYAARKFTLVPNGFDVLRLTPDEQARASVRQELHLQPDAPLVGMIARYDPQKDHRNFFKAASRVHKIHPKAIFVCCGDGMTLDNTEIYDRVAEAGIGSVLKLLGRRSDIPRLNAAFDIAVSASRYGEGFPNVIGEAMACGVPCVVTESGDAPFVVGDTGYIVPPGKNAALADAIINLLNLGPDERHALGLRARQRIIENFDIQQIAEKYASFYETLCHVRPSPVPKEAG